MFTTQGGRSVGYVYSLSDGTVHGPTQWTSTLCILVVNQSWFDISTSPFSNGILVGCTGGSHVFATVWDGTTWTPTIDFTDSTYQGGFAVAFEAISGQAMLVYSLKKGSRGIRKWHSP